jgi:hypothetical protein
MGADMKRFCDWCGVCLGESTVTPVGPLSCGSFQCEEWARAEVTWQPLWENLGSAPTRKKRKKPARNGGVE